jgi:hypothetical protein
MFSDATLSDINVVLCYVLSQYRCVHRLPVVSPALNPQEAAMMEMLRQLELEDSMLSDHEVRHKSVFFVPFLVVCFKVPSCQIGSA